MRLCSQFSWVSISFADRDLVFQDFSLVLVPGMRLSSFARAGARACGAARAPESREERAAERELLGARC